MAAKRAKAPSADPPFAYLGHGSSKTSDALTIWVRFARVPSEPERAEIEAAIPDVLRERVGDEHGAGAIRWTRDVLVVESGMDFAYFVPSLDPKRLKWLDGRGGTELTGAEVDQVLREVMNRDRTGPRDPGKSAWAAFDAEVDDWLLCAASTAPISFVVKDSDVGKKPSAWHAWSATAGRERLFANLAEVVAGLGPSPVEAVIDFCAAAAPVKTWSEDEIDAAIDLLRLAGVGRPDPLAKLVAASPPKKKKARVVALLGATHPGALHLFLASGTWDLLLDDDVFATAKGAAGRCALYPWLWVHGVDERSGLRRRSSTEDPVEVVRKKGAKTVTWLQRMTEIAQVSGRIEAAAAEEAARNDANKTSRAQLAQWRHITDLVAKL